MMHRLDAGAPRGARPPRAAVFLDKDGTLVEDVPFNVDPAQLRFAPRAFQALRRLAARGFALVIVSNQPGLACGRFDAGQWAGMRVAIEAAFAQAGVPLAAVCWCPHAPDGAGRPLCSCRKPEPGMLLAAAHALGLALPRSWMVGDILDDVEAGCRAGCRTVLLDVGHETVWARGPQRVPDARVPGLWEAAHHIIEHAGAAASPARRRSRASA